MQPRSAASSDLTKTARAMAWRPRSLGLLWLLYVAAFGYALFAWGPALIERYDRISERHPQLAYVYLASVAIGGLILLALSGALFARLWKNTRAKRRREAHRRANPSELSAAQQQAELAENLARSQTFADDDSASPELRKQLTAQLSALEEKQTGQQLEIVAFGTISSGKSALLNALAGRDVFSTDVVGGTTTSRCEIPWPGADRVRLVDTPGLAEVAGQRRASLSAAAAQDVEIVLLVVDGPLKSYEVDLALRLLDLEKRLIVCLNKQDWYEASQQRELLAQITEQLPRVERADIVAVQAAAVARPRVRILADGREEQEFTDSPPDVQPLARRMLEVIRRDGRDLLLANLLLQSRGLVEDAKKQIRRHLDERADQIVSRYMWAIGSAAAVNPFPLLDLAGSSALTLKMVLDLARVYRQPLDADMAVKILADLGKNLLAILGVTAAAPIAASLIGSMLKTVPGVGTLAGGMIQGLSQGLITRWVGNVFVRYLQNEMQPPPGGLAETAREEWKKITTSEALRDLIREGRAQLAERREKG
jgi:small GTP-binding protein